MKRLSLLLALALACIAPATAQIVNPQFLQSGTGAVARPISNCGANGKLCDVVNARDYGVKCDNATNDSPAIQVAFTAATGKRLRFPAGRCLMNTAVTLVSNIVIEGEGPGATYLVSNAALGQISATSKTNITFRDIGFAGNGFSNVPTFTLSSYLLFDNVLVNGQLAGPALSSVGLRFQGSTHINITNSQLFDADSLIYLDASGGTQSDFVTVSNVQLEHTFVGNSNNPTGIYQYKADHLTVNGVTCKNILAGGGAPIAGYCVYAGDGASVSTVVTNSRCINTDGTRKMICVQDAQSTDSRAIGNTVIAAAGSGSQLYQGGTTKGHVIVADNYAQQATIQILGGATAATGLESAIVQNNTLYKVEYPSCGILVGVGGSYYVARARIANNFVFGTYAASLCIMEAAYADIEGNKFLNANTENGYSGHTEPAYVSAVAWDGTVPNVGRFAGNVIDNQGGYTPLGYAKYALDVASATNTIFVAGDNSFSGMVTGNLHNVVPQQDSGSWTPSVGGTATYLGQSGSYRKVGSIVFATFDLTVNAIGSGSPSSISGLPYAAVANDACHISYSAGLAVNVVYLAGYTSGTGINLTGLAAAGGNIQAVNVIGNGTRVMGSCVYAP